MGNKLLTVFVILFSIHLNAQFASRNLSDRKEIRELLQKHKVPAMGLGIIENAELVQMSTYGELKTGVSAPYNAIFDIASLTKSIVTMATLQLVENGDWNLDEPLYNYWIDPDIEQDPLHKKITTRHVLTHTTGFNNWRWMNDSKQLEFVFEPGTQFKYSGEGFEYLRKALEVKFQVSLQQLSDSLLFQPLGMVDTRHSWGSDVDVKRFAIGHDTLKNPYQIPKGKLANGADNALTTIKDFGIFGVNVINKIERNLLVYQEMVRPQINIKENIAMGLGWFVFPNLSSNEYALYNAGGDEGTHTVIVLLPKSKNGIVIMTNGDNGYLLYQELIPKLLDVGTEIITRIQTR